MANGLRTSVNAVKDTAARENLLGLGLKVDQIDKTLSTLRRNNQNVVSYALDSVTINAGSGLTGGGDLTANRTINVGAGFGITVAADSVAVDQGMVPTWTGIHTFSAQDVHNAGVSLGTSGAFVSNTANGTTPWDFQDSAGAGVRVSGNMILVRRASDNRQTLMATWDGRYSFGYRTTLQPQTGHVLSFVQIDSESPAGAPHYVGILGYGRHDSASQTVPYIYGLVGAAGIDTATGLSGTLMAGTVGSVFTTSGIVSGVSTINTVGVVGNAGGSGAIGGTAGGSEPTALLQTGTSWAVMHLRGAFAGNGAFANIERYATSTVGVIATTDQPALGWGYRVVIPHYPGANSNTVGNQFGETWGIMGVAQTTAATVHAPAVTGFLKIVYPRRTTNAATRATQLNWEAWPNTSTIRANAATGDHYFDDGTNFATGHWTRDSAGWVRLLTDDVVCWEDDPVIYDDDIVGYH